MRLESFLCTDLLFIQVESPTQNSPEVLNLCPLWTTHTHRYKETDTHRYKETYTHVHTHIDIKRQTHIDIKRQTHIDKKRQTHIDIKRHRHMYTHKETERGKER